MQYLFSLLILAVALVMQGCAPEPESTPPPVKESVAQPTAQTAPTDPWYESVTDPKSAVALYKSPSDDRGYRYLVLENGLKVLLISDPEADKAAASLSIDVGSFENPADREGLAHFLEHMLFLGTDKYPEAGEYQAYLTEHGGTFNAYTSLEETNYFFDVDASYLEQTLDRFARFFVAPRFNEEYVDRERHAVDSEYQLKIKDDSRREWDVLRELANPEHPFALFAVGTLDTLKNTDADPVRQDLLAFYQKYYSASHMNLVVLGSESLDQLDQLVRGRFAEVPAHKVELAEQYKPLFKEKLPIKVSIRPEKEMRSLSFNFPLPSVADDWRLKPTEYLGHLLGHEGKGSLLSLLKNEGLAEGLNSGLVFDSRHGSLFSVNIQLTPEGLKQEQLVTRYFFQWLQRVKDQGLEDWRYHEVARMSEIDFQFKEKADAMGYVSQLSTSLHYFSPEEILRGNNLYDKFDVARLKELGGYLTAENVAIFLTAPDVNTDRKTRFYQAPYTVAAVDVSSLQVAEPGEKLTLPAANPYIPGNLALIDGQGMKTPEALGDQPGVWFYGANPFQSPKAFFESRIALPGDIGIEQATATEFLLALVMDELSSEMYPAMLAGLGFSLNPWERGYTIAMTGYSEKQPVLLERILGVLQSPDWDEERVARVRATMIRNWRNAAKDWPLKQLFARFPPLVKNDWMPADKATQLEKMSLAEIKQVHAGITRGAAGRFYGAGNFTAADMQGLVGQVTKSLELAAGQGSEPLVVRNLTKAKPLFATDYFVDHDDSAALLYLQGDSDNLQERATFALLEVMTSAPFYSSLRTEKQLGYAVGSSIAPVVRVPGMLFFVQSPKVDANTLRKEINGFFNGLSGQVAAMTQEDLDRYRSSVLASVEEKPKNLNELAQRHLESLNLGYQGFDFRERLVKAINAITLEQFQADFKRVMAAGERTGFWILTTSDKSAGSGQAIPDDYLEEQFSYGF